MRIGRREIGAKNPVYIIAEISANHCHSSSYAAVLIEAAANSGADAVKFQTYEPREFIHPFTMVPFGYDPVIDERLGAFATPNMANLFLRGGLPKAWHKDMLAIAKDHGIDFLSTPFSIPGAKFLAEEIGVKALKIASGDITFYPLLEYVASTGLPIILSTGASTKQEITDVVTGPLRSVYEKGNLAILHCRSIYPCPLGSMGLKAITELKSLFSQAQIGLSDHSLSTQSIPALAVNEGVTIYEKHLRLDLPLTSADTYHSITPSEFLEMAATIRATPKIMYGTGIDPVEDEMHDRLWARRDPSDYLRPTQQAREGKWQ